MRFRTKTMMAIAAATFAVVACSDRNDADVAPTVGAGPATAEDRSYAVAADTRPTPAADNTGRNARDRNDETLTPGDQSNSAPDVALTQTIRKGITSDDTMSMQARNVKVITQDGVVTLRGPVETQQEKQSIETLAKNAGATRIDNQIEIDRDAPGDEE